MFKSKYPIVYGYTVNYVATGMLSESQFKNIIQKLKDKDIKYKISKRYSRLGHGKIAKFIDVEMNNSKYSNNVRLIEVIQRYKFLHKNSSKHYELIDMVNKAYRS